MGSEQKHGFGEKLIEKLHIGKHGHSAPSKVTAVHKGAPVESVPLSRTPRTEDSAVPAPTARPTQGTGYSSSGQFAAPSGIDKSVAEPTSVIRQANAPAPSPGGLPSGTDNVGLQTRPQAQNERGVDLLDSRHTAGLKEANPDFEPVSAQAAGNGRRSSTQPFGPSHASEQAKDVSKTASPGEHAGPGLTPPPKQSTAPTLVGQVQQSAAQAASAAAASAQQLAAFSKDKATQAYSAVGSEMDRQGLSASSKRAMADIGQGLQDYSAVGQERAAAALQQAVDTAHEVGSDPQNRSIVLRILGAVVLIWLAFGFSLRALLTLGLVAAGALVLTQYSRRGAAAGQHSRHAQADHSRVGHPASTLQAPKPDNAPVETHYPTAKHGGPHPDSSSLLM